MVIKPFFNLSIRIEMYPTCKWTSSIEARKYIKHNNSYKPANEKDKENQLNWNAKFKHQLSTIE